MLMKNWIRKPTIAAHMKTSPTCDVMYGHSTNSPEPIAVARMITLAPATFLNGTGSGRSRVSTAGR